MVLTLVIPLAQFYELEELFTMRHLDNMAKLMLATGLMVSYGYYHRGVYGVVQRQHYERFVVLNRAVWALRLGVLAADATTWSSRNPVVEPHSKDTAAFFWLRFRVNVGMWLERFVIVVDQPAPRFFSFHLAHVLPDVWDWATLLGSIALFVTLFLLFIRLLPPISIFEMKEILHKPEVSALCDEGESRSMACLRNSRSRETCRSSQTSKQSGLSQNGWVFSFSRRRARRSAGLPRTQDSGNRARRRTDGRTRRIFYAVRSSVAFYPINVAGRPFHSWPMFIPITFELTILFSGLFTAIGMLALNGLPKPHHPVFAVPQFSLATDDRFFF